MKKSSRARDTSFVTLYTIKAIKPTVAMTAANLSQVGRAFQMLVKVETPVLVN
jgi:hypothetical protein